MVNNQNIFEKEEYIMDKKFLASLIILFFISTSAYADRRGYVWTYEYHTLPKGDIELEQYLTTELPDLGNTKVNRWKYWLEVEYGITDHWDISLYQMFKNVNKENNSWSEYDGFKVRTRYRFGEKGLTFIDPLLYLEYIRNDDFSKPNILEGKLILAKNIKRIDFSYNLIFKGELESDGVTEHEYAAGMSYEIIPAFKFGMESKGNYTEDEYSIGPTISWATQKFWITIGSVFGLNRRTRDLDIRMIFGIPF
jgi:hypothetical protein